MSGRKKNILGAPALVRIREESAALKMLLALEEAAEVPPEYGGFHFTLWERQFIQDVRRRHNATLELTPEQRDRIKAVWKAFSSASSSAKR